MLQIGSLGCQFLLFLFHLALLSSIFPFSVHSVMVFLQACQVVSLMYQVSNLVGRFDLFLFSNKISMLFSFSLVVNDKQPVRSTVVGTPILLALEDVDGAPTFLEKALRFVEEHGEFFLVLIVAISFK